ncbi:M16 family metallopeptidase [Mucilaginibacter gotjawali]|uniref:Zn-dependent peptidase n=2 Tax=Mucilaginibacter gotjawali TaxID=1550579 RepID=A0A839SI96_9SPHI|nr:pitrilysin family protein [Mucilaginibacter gotjawali]MBB3056299.1 putative Zn-dependent peptidase [Mucilaginibacter gotjawali]BAU55003.1 Peptidase M16 inactive domain protein [Mucilaginibacter gotjawali]
MVKFNRFTLDNGLRVIVHEDDTTPMAVLNILYDVGARDEDPEQTGFAHLFEHLMFGGSVNIPDYDQPLQRVGGENNAFTSNDITNYYITLPSSNIETAFWLESDRMLSLAFSEKSLEVQRAVVIEEFKQRYLNQPYGDVWLKLRPLVYKKHPYQWATIGKELKHIEDAKIEDVKAFFKKHYNPQNAVMVVGGDVKTEDVKKLAEKWFGPIPAGEKYHRNLPQEPDQHDERRLTVTGKVPLDDVYIAFQMGARLDESYYVAELISDILSRGNSARLYRNLVKEKHIFSEVHAYMTGSMDKGMFVFEGKPLENISLEAAEAAIWEELERLKTELVPADELTKVQNKIESTMIFSEMALLDKAMNLASFELMGDADMLNHETAKYLAVTPERIKDLSNQLFRKDNSSTMIYLAEKAV